MMIKLLTRKLPINISKDFVRRLEVTILGVKKRKSQNSSTLIKLNPIKINIKIILSVKQTKSINLMFKNLYSLMIIIAQDVINHYKKVLKKSEQKFFKLLPVIKKQQSNRWVQVQSTSLCQKLKMSSGLINTEIFLNFHG